MWYLVFSKPAAPREEIRALAPDHAAWLRRQHAEGNVLISGPVTDGSGGIWVLRAGSREEAKALADSNPYHAKGVRQYEMFEWNVHQVMGVGPFSAESVRLVDQERQEAVR